MGTLPCIIGGSCWDITSTLTHEWTPKEKLASSFPGSVMQTPGGVARNIAETMSRLSVPSKLVSCIGTDETGELMARHFEDAMMDKSLVEKVQNYRTATYSAFHGNEGNLIVAVADMEIFDQFYLRPSVTESILHLASMLIVDANVNQKVFFQVVAMAIEQDIPLIIEPTSVSKAMRIKWSKIPQNVNLWITPNLFELEIISNSLGYHGVCPKICSSVAQYFPRCPAQASLAMGIQVAQHFPNILLKLGKHGVAYVGVNDGADQPVWNGASGPITVAWEPPSRVVSSPISVTGAGDSFVGAMAAGLYFKGFYDKNRMGDVLKWAQTSSLLSLQTHFAVSPVLSMKKMGNLF